MFWGRKNTANENLFDTSVICTHQPEYMFLSDETGQQIKLCV